MLRAFWTWDPVSSGTYRAFDEPHAYSHNKWFFDKSVWQKMFRTMSGCGLNAMVLANTHPFPFMIDMSAYPDAKVIDDASASSYQQMHHWIFETALDYGIAPHLLFFSIYYPEPMLKARGIKPKDIVKPTDLALEYTNYCVRTLLGTYPELAGIFADIGEGIAGNVQQFVQQAIVEAADAVRPDAPLYLRGWQGDPKDLIDGVKRRSNHRIAYSVKYTGEHIVDENPDPSFSQWIEAAGAENVTAEFRVSNSEPWTSFSYDAAEGIVSKLEDLGCDGFSLQPLSLYEWPHTSDASSKYQWQRDMVWYSVWGGTNTRQLIREGLPKWLVRNQKLLPGFQAGSRILELLALYFAGDKQGNWRPQFCSIGDKRGAHLLSTEDMLHLDDMPQFSGRNWWTEITGDKVVHLAEYIQSGTPEDAYGPEELIEELTDLSEQAIASGEKGMRSDSGEKELPSLSRDAYCMGRLGEFYIERFRAALSHARGNDAEAAEHLTRALGFYRDMAAVDSSHQTLPLRIISGRGVAETDWADTIKALEAELADAAKGEFKRGSEFPVLSSTVK